MYVRIKKKDSMSAAPAISSLSLSLSHLSLSNFLLRLKTTAFLTDFKRDQRPEL